MLCTPRVHLRLFQIFEHFDRDALYHAVVNVDVVHLRILRVQADSVVLRFRVEPFQCRFVIDQRNNDITGDGNLTVTGDLTNNGDIEQALVSITSGVTENNGTIVTTGEGIEITKGSTLITHGELNTWENGGQITNDGTLNVNVLTSEGEADNVENKNDIQTL